jgi:hypothetical protein
LRGFFRSVTLFELCSTLGGRPTVGPQTLNLLIGVQIPASQSAKSPDGNIGAFACSKLKTALLSQEGSTIETAVEIVRGVVPKPQF